MKIEFIQISNILSFKFISDISEAQKITFDDGLNIIIGENGSGKSTALEVINFLFKRVLYRQFNVNQDLFSRRTQIAANERQQVIQPANQQAFSGFRLDPNWDTEDRPQVIRLSVGLDEIDKKNIENIRKHYADISHAINAYSTHNISDDGKVLDKYVVDITLDRARNRFTTSFHDGNEDFGFKYLAEYHFFKEAISIHNFLNPSSLIPTLYESFTLISSYRNYHAFQPSVSLKDEHPAQQIQKIRSQDFDRSLNASDKNEPPVFALVRLQVAEKHFGLILKDKSDEQCEAEANSLPFIQSINERLKVVNLECKIKLLDHRTWQYSFEFFDTRRQQKINDINCLSAGQKAIIHLVFEAYGRGDIKGGVVIIDEPEIHLHYQFQHEYLQVIDDLNKDQNCQYILVTHSEALINSTTINSVRRFSLDTQGHTKVFSPKLNTDQQSLIKILDNTRSTYAFFSKKVLLVEDDTDRYFFRAVIQESHPELGQEIAVLHIGGKGEFPKWRELFTSFGLAVFAVADFDYLINLHYPECKSLRLKSKEDLVSFKKQHPDWNTRIEQEYSNKIFILKLGDLEFYLSINKGLNNTIRFCENDLKPFLDNESSENSKEIRSIINKLIA